MVYYGELFLGTHWKFCFYTVGLRLLIKLPEEINIRYVRFSAFTILKATDL
jgi:hypothetical protein